ncbi:MAG: hypothetical protein JKY54_07295 [Flavobacteriales bacterium]|nr:hypothetical protein [Flavobacteriales bacterium]
MIKNLSKFQKRTIFFLLLAFIVQGGLIAVLLIALNISNERLQSLGNIMDEMSEDHIIYTMHITQDMPIKTRILIEDEVEVNINMLVESEIPFRAEIPVTEEMLIPFKIGVHDYIKLDTTIEITDQVHIFVDDTIPLDQLMKVKMFGQKKNGDLRGPSMHVRSKIPLHQDLLITFNEKMHVNSVIPIDMLIIDTLPVGLSMKIPVDLMVPIRIPLKTTAIISFSESMAIDAIIPISLEVPIDIPLKETSLAGYFKRMAKGMRNLTKVEPEKGAYPEIEAKAKK